MVSGMNRWGLSARMKCAHRWMRTRPRWKKSSALTTVVGHAYAQGSTSPAAQAYLKAQGYQYAREVFPSGGFAFPEDPMNFRPSSSLILKNAAKLVERFKCEEPGEKDLLLFLWAHSYEMDYDKGNASWYALERLFESIAGRNDIVYCTNSEAFAHI